MGLSTVVVPGAAVVVVVGPGAVDGGGGAAAGSAAVVAGALGVVGRAVVAVVAAGAGRAGGRVVGGADDGVGRAVGAVVGAGGGAAVVDVDDGGTGAGAVTVVDVVASGRGGAVATGPRATGGRPTTPGWAGAAGRPPRGRGPAAGAASQLERLAVDLAGGDAGVAQRLPRPLHQPGRAAEEDVVVGEVGQERPQRLGAEGVGRLVAGAVPVEDAGPAPLGDGLELVAEDGVLRARRPVQEREVARPGGQRLEQREQRGDADTAGHQQDPAAGAA